MYIPVYNTIKNSLNNSTDFFFKSKTLQQQGFYFTRTATALRFPGVHKTVNSIVHPPFRNIHSIPRSKPSNYNSISYSGQQPALPKNSLVCPEKITGKKRTHTHSRTLVFLALHTRYYCTRGRAASISISCAGGREQMGCASS